jgi:hypothetical protein
MVTTAAPSTRAAGLNCPSCGAGIALSTAGWSVSVVCATCGAVLDAQDPNLRILQQHAQRITVAPRIPLGTRGTWNGTKWDVVGFQQMTITVEGDDYSWREYVCFNPYRGFLYLSEYDGHWNVTEKLQVRPGATSSPSIAFNGRVFKHFQTARARTTFALGEFPWEVNVGDQVETFDYVSPPYMLSAEGTQQEVTWSLGTYTAPEAIARAFTVTGALAEPIGVFSNQPNPYTASSDRIGRMFRVLALLLLVMLGANYFLARRETVFDKPFHFDRATGDTAAFVTDPFDLKGRLSNIDFTITTNLDNNWLWFDLALIDETTGQALDVGREVSYYHGSDSDGSWTEGARSDHFKLGSVPAGRYILRVAADQPDAPENIGANTLSVAYSIVIRRDVPSYVLYVVAFFALLLPAGLLKAPAMSFEQRRWAESDSAPVRSSSSSDDDDD